MSAALAEATTATAVIEAVLLETDASSVLIEAVLLETDASRVLIEAVLLETDVSTAETVDSRSVTAEEFVQEPSHLNTSPVAPGRISTARDVTDSGSTASVISLWRPVIERPILHCVNKKRGGCYFLDGGSQFAGHDVEGELDVA
jgi:hypothetical protein